MVIEHTSRWTLLASVVLLALPVHAQSVLDQLTGSVSKSDASRFVGDNKPMVLTIDGIDPKLIPGLKNYTGFAADGRGGESYLADAVKSQWDFVDDSDVYHSPWSGDPANTDADLREIKTQITSLADLAASEGQPLVILSHSWGSVIAYRAISELWGEGKLKRDSIRKFVTMGSPIGSESVTVNTYTQTKLNWSGTNGILEPAGSWTNFWMKRDNVSGEIDAIDHNVSLTYSFFKPHEAYYNNPSLFNRVAEVVAVDLASFEATPQSADTPMRPSSVAATPVAATTTMVGQNTNSARSTSRSERSLEIFGLSLGMTVDEVIAVLHSKGVEENERATRVSGSLITGVDDLGNAEQVHGYTVTYGQACNLYARKINKLATVCARLVASILVPGKEERYALDVVFVRELPLVKEEYSVQSIQFWHFYPGELGFSLRDFLTNKYGQFERENRSSGARHPRDLLNPPKFRGQQTRMYYLTATHKKNKYEIGFRSYIIFHGAPISEDHSNALEAEVMKSAPAVDKADTPF
jgi:hypothetical protein